MHAFARECSADDRLPPARLINPNLNMHFCETHNFLVSAAEEWTASRDHSTGTMRFSVWESSSDFDKWGKLA